MTEIAPPDNNKPPPSIRPLLIRISLAWLLVFFADTWIDLLVNCINLLVEGVTTLYDLLIQSEGLVMEVIGKAFDLSNRTAELVTFYSLLPFQILLIGYLTLRFVRWLKRLPAVLNSWQLKEKTLIVSSWQQLKWFWKLGIISVLLASSLLLF